MRSSGRRFNPAPHPPGFMSRPWYPLIVRLENFSVTITTQVLAAAIASQLGISVADGILNVRLQSVRLWGAITAQNASTALQPLVCVFYDMIQAQQNQTGLNAVRVLEQITEYPDQVSRAAVGYTYDESHQDISIWMSGSQIPAAIIAVTGGGPGSVAYFKLLWRCGQTTPSLQGLSLDDFISEDDEARSNTCARRSTCGAYCCK